jgi:5-oxoprolinase (ATP-hydrolysing)
MAAPVSSATPGQAREMRPAGAVRSWDDRRWRQLPVYHRDDLRPGDRAGGPALVTEEHSTTVVEPGWRLVVDGAGTLVLERGAMR